ncbi:Clathrin heavy chain 1 [Trichinella nativa]|uniref:Clathrin heavy chain 1 n=1 Tax=Trichinella nativa TaxID=6335 RepID=A0A0V1KN79_9BILA|nr:Clathrin heavy chain 1 [Trichinella nativa]KRZ48740.1 Clathrin heavy chain 1 [Trichinella nativa]KRZ51410.1 Clathrin heavy chain 1 [Trichinella nativa]KRZ55002.1 Clathrin heavy chain 1 [Trichinella nativa]KRZ59812.1 Clathrin heavy chain 1 [Trichinella nativa]
MFFAFSTQCTLLCFIGFDLYYGWLIHVENLSKYGCIIAKKVISFSFSHGRRDDFPVAIQTNDKYGILFVMSSYGYLHVIDVNDSICLYEGILTNYKVVSPAAHKDSGIVCVNEKGYIVTAVVDEEEVISCLRAEGVFAWKFWELCDNGEYYKAAELAVIIHVDSLAPEKIIEYLRSAELGKKEPNSVFLYFKRRLENGPLNNIVKRKEKFHHIFDERQQNNKMILCCSKNWAICSKNMTTFWPGQRIYEPVAILRLLNDFPRNIS